MKIAFIADGRSEHARRWISYFATNNDVLLISTYECELIENITTVVLPGRFRLSGQLMVTNPSDIGKYKFLSKIITFALRGRFTNYIWNQLKLIDLLKQIKKTRKELKEYRPDLVHALRIQNEGYLAAFSWDGRYIISSWGSDFIETAKNYPLHRLMTSYVLRKTKYFMSDCQRDLRLASEYGLSEGAKKFIAPGNGGVDIQTFYPDRKLPVTRTILYCRGLSKVTRVDTLFAALQTMLNDSKYSDISLIILAPCAVHQKFFEEAQTFKIDKPRIQISDYVSAFGLSKIMRECTVFVSPLTSDGVPNSMLEAMACGMIPVMSDLESIREFIDDEVNGLTFDPMLPDSLVSALKRAFGGTISEQRRLENIQLVKMRSEYNKSLKLVNDFYTGIVGDIR